MVHHLVIGIIFLIWGIADVLRLELPGILGKRLESASAEARRLWQRLLVCWSSSWAAGSCCSTFSPTTKPSPASSSR